MSFDPRAEGTDPEVWDAYFAEHAVPPLRLAGVTGVVVVAAHPDDETLGAGGLVACCARDGIDVTVLMVTDGAASHPASPTHTAERLRAIRRLETERAVAIVAPHATVHPLDIADGTTDDARERIGAAVRARVGPGTLLVAPFRGDGHRDHRVVGEVCAAVAAAAGCDLAEYPIWYWHWAAPAGDATRDHMVALRLDDEARAAKHLAIEAYASQIAPLGPETGNEAVLTSGFLRHFRQRAERFVVTPASAAMPHAYFDAVYARSPDPWRLATRRYEARKRAVTLASLPLDRYRSALEIGCSIGVLTEALAPRCEHLLAVDIAAAAVDAAARRTERFGSVAVHRRDVALGLPDGQFDLIVLSEVGYYFSADALSTLARRVRRQLTESGTVVACHWRHPVADYPQSGDAVHAVLRAELGLESTVEHRERDFVLEIFEADPRSPAEREGLVA